VGKVIRPEYGWGILVPSATDNELFLSIYTIRGNREDAIRKIGDMWHETDWRKGWKRAYRDGYRAVRVAVSVFGAVPSADRLAIREPSDA